MEQIDPIKRQAVQDALEFVASRNNMDLTEKQFIEVINSIYQFYTNGEEQQRNKQQVY